MDHGRRPLVVRKRIVRASGTRNAGPGVRGKIFRPLWANAQHCAGPSKPREGRFGETRLSERHKLEKPERLDGVGLFTVLDLELK